MRGPRQQVEVFEGEDGNYYIRNIAAWVLFNDSTINRDDKPNYMLTAEQFEYIKENYEIVWRDMKRRLMLVNDKPDDQDYDDKPDDQDYDDKPDINVYVGEDGEYYIRSVDARRIFQIETKERYYKLTEKQLRLLQRNYHILWHFMAAAKIPINSPENDIKGKDPNFVRLANSLVRFAKRNNIDENYFLELFFPVYYVTLNCDDNKVHGGEIGYDGKLSGISEFVEENGGFSKIRNNERKSYVDYLKELIQHHGVIQVKDIHDYVDATGLYKFVGKWPEGPIVNYVEPSGVDKNKKETFSSCLLGYINSKCKGRYIDEFNNLIKSDDINIKEIREKQISKTR